MRQETQIMLKIKKLKDMTGMRIWILMPILDDMTWKVRRAAARILEILELAAIHS